MNSAHAVNFEQEGPSETRHQWHFTGCQSDLRMSWGCAASGGQGLDAMAGSRADSCKEGPTVETPCARTRLSKDCLTSSPSNRKSKGRGLSVLQHHQRLSDNLNISSKQIKRNSMGARNVTAWLPVHPPLNNGVIRRQEDSC